MGPSGERRGILDPSSPDFETAKYPDARLRIGSSLARLRLELIEAGNHLCEVLEPAGAGLVADAMRVLENQICRVAVIGQIKAGKSSFINALVQQPDLLPTDVNPWTTATTNLHFRAQQQGQDSAIFHFFSTAEWDQLADGGGKLRELTERLVPGFEPELLRRHASVVRKRAAARLGPEFANLLGREHRFAKLSPDTLRQYVCQGEMTGVPGGDRSVGRYSDITKSADVYLDSGPFDYPTTVIDTPGTNDPFLIRDEITRRCLESADLYIVVLTARQALSAADVALLRILRGLHKERIVIILNRIDELTDIANDVELVLGSVRRRLRNEFSGADIALIPGSAWWANCAVAGQGSSIDHLLGARAMSYFRQRGFLQQDLGMRPAQDDENDTALRAALMAASGLGQVYEALDKLQGSSNYAYVLRQMTSCFAEMVGASERAERQELQSLARRPIDMSARANHNESEVSRLRGELQKLNEVSMIINETASLFKARQMEIVSRELAVMRNHLERTVSDCAANQRYALANELQAGKTVRTWVFDSQSVRRDLAGEFIDGFRRAENALLELQKDVVPYLRRFLTMLVSNANEVTKFGTVHRPVPPPTMMPLGASIALDLDASWWSMVWRTKPEPWQRGRELERLITAEFSRVVDELIGACERSLTSHVASTTEWTFGICDSIARSIAGRREHLVEYYEKLQQEIDGDVDRESDGARRQHISRSNAHIEKCAALSRIFQRIERDIDRDLPEIRV